MLGSVRRELRIVSAPLGALVGVAVVAAACSGTKSDHPGAAQECGPNLTCLGIGGPGGVSGGNPDASTTTDTGPADTVPFETDGGLQQISVGAIEIHKSTFVSRDPALEPLDTTDIVKGGITVGGAWTAFDITGGKFGVAKVDATTDQYSWIVLQRKDAAGTITTQTVANVQFDGTTLSVPGPLFYPYYDPALRGTLATQAGVSITLDGTASIVVQVVDSTGTPMSGVTASFAGTSSTCATGVPCGPYYDGPGDTIVTRGAGTGPLGTIVFLNVPGSSVPAFASKYAQVIVTPTGKAPVTLPFMLVVPDAFSFVRQTLK